MEKDKYQILKEWNELLESGVITEAEFLAKKQEVFGSDLSQKSNNSQSKSFNLSSQNLKSLKIGGAILGILILVLLAIKFLPRTNSVESISVASKTEDKSEEKEVSEKPIEEEQNVNTNNINLSPEYAKTYLYSGEVAKMPITMKVRVVRNKLGEVSCDGFYYYNDRKINISLDGYLNPNSSNRISPPLKIIEFYEGKVTGSFNFSKNEIGESTIKGIWKTPDNKKSFPFTLNLVKEIIFDEFSNYSGDWESGGLYRTEDGEVARNGYGEIIFGSKSLQIEQNGDILIFSIGTAKSTGCTGFTEGKCKINGNKAIFNGDEETPCKLTFTLNGDTIEVEDECTGFHGASCTFSGTFRRVLK